MLPNFIDKSTLPHKPGVYLYKDHKGTIIYVGKAIDLYHRVSSYFSKTIIDSKTVNLVKDITSVETIEVESELEALILEANLIKKHLPKYNIRLTDDKDYLYIKITNELYPRVLTARKNDLDDAKEYFGPFPSSQTVRNTLKRLRRIFPWCQYPSIKPGQKIYPRPCFYYHLKLCPGSCVGKIDPLEQQKNIKKFILFLQGNKEQLINDLEAEMEKYSQTLEYEKAAQVKRTLEGITYLLQQNRAEVYLENPNFIENQNKLAIEQLKSDLNLKQLPERIECFDISNIQGQFAVGSLVVLTSGDIDKKWYRKFKIRLSGKPNDVGMMREIVTRRLNHPEWPMPDLIIVDGGKGQVNGVVEILKEKGWQISIFGLAKRLEWLYSPEKVIKLKRDSLSLRVIQKIRDEAHRVAINYHRKLRDRQNY